MKHESWARKSMRDLTVTGMPKKLGAYDLAPPTNYKGRKDYTHHKKV